MSTRCQIEIRDEYSEKGKKDIMLYHHYDGYPDNMIPLIKQGLKGFDKSGAEPYWWDTERVAAHFVANVDNDSSFPTFQPSCCVHGDIEYYYVVTLINKGGDIGKLARSFKIEYEDYANEEAESKTKKITQGKID